MHACTRSLISEGFHKTRLAYENGRRSIENASLLDPSGPMCMHASAARLMMQWTYDHAKCEMPSTWKALVSPASYALLIIKNLIVISLNLTKYQFWIFHWWDGFIMRRMTQEWELIKIHHRVLSKIYYSFLIEKWQQSQHSDYHSSLNLSN